MAFAFPYGHGLGFGLGFLNFIGTILFFVVLVWVVRFVLSGGRRSLAPGCSRWGRGGGYRARPRSHDDAIDALRSRLARGDIDRDAFDRLRSALGGEPSGADDDSGPGAHPFARWLHTGDQPIDIARGRLARGEITVEEFEALKRALAA